MISNWIYFVSFAVSILGCLIFGIIVFKHFRRIPHSRLRVIDFMLSVFFTGVAIVVSIDLFLVAHKFDVYVNDTLPRDDQQEQCEKDILHVLRIWAASREDLEAAQAAREKALLPFYAQFGASLPLNPETAQDVIRKTEDLEQARFHEQAIMDDNPIPDCNLGLNHG